MTDQHHPNFCPGTWDVLVYEDWLLRVTECKVCKVRTGQPKQGGIFGWLTTHFYGHWRMERVFHEQISWWKADEF